MAIRIIYILVTLSKIIEPQGSVAHLNYKEIMAAMFNARLEFCEHMFETIIAEIIHTDFQLHQSHRLSAPSVTQTF